MLSNRRLRQRFLSHRLRARARLPSAVGLTIVATGFQGLAAVLTARWLGPASRGDVVVAISIASLLQVLAGLGVPIASRALLASNPSVRSVHRLVRDAARLCALSVPASMGCGVIVFILLAERWEARTIVAFSAYSAMVIVVPFAREALHGLGAHVGAIGGDSAAALAQVVSVIALEWQGHLSVFSYLIVCAATLMFQAVLSAVGVFLRAGRSGHAIDAQPKQAFYGPGVRSLLRRSVPVLVWSLALAFVWKGDRIILGAMRKSSDVGIYAAAASLADIAWVVPLSLSAMVTRDVAATASLDPAVRWRRRALTITLPAAAGLALLARPLLETFFGAAYSGGDAAARLLCLASVPLALAQVDMAACLGAGDARTPPKAALTAAGVLAVFAIPLSFQFGATGCAIASVAAYSMMAYVSRRGLRRLVCAENSTSLTISMDGTG